MDPEPEIRYVRSGGVAIAYQVIGHGDVDLVYAWEIPLFRDFYERLAQSFRLIRFDKRGTGLSDHGPQFAALETRMEDLRAVLDAARAERPVVVAAQEGCNIATLFAASYPERVRALALFHPVAQAPGASDRAVLEGLADLRERWGTREFCDDLFAEIAPSLSAEAENRRWFANWLRVGASPAAAYALNRAWDETDLRDVLPAVRVPTLVLYRSTPFGQDEALDVAERIPDARALRLSGEDYWEMSLSPEVVDELERFVAGEELPAVPESVLATLMFTDLVGSTERAAALGDRAWRDLLAEHNALVRRELARFRGEERDTAGDGFFATFDGPARAVRGLRRPRRARRNRARGAHRHPRRRVRAARGQACGDRAQHRRADRRRGRCGRGARLRHGARPRRGLRARLRGPRHAGAEGRSGRVAALRRPPRAGVRLTPSPAG